VPRVEYERACHRHSQCIVIATWLTPGAPLKLLRGFPNDVRRRLGVAGGALGSLLLGAAAVTAYWLYVRWHRSKVAMPDPTG
jgi:hypothetical protein